jgi:hypothetical protein
VAEDREGEAPAEPKASLSSASAGGMHNWPPADADLLVGLGSVGVSPSRKSLTALSPRVRGQSADSPATAD